MDELRLFVRAIFSHWLTLMSGGVIIVAVGIYERVAGGNVPWSIYLSLICALIVIASFLAWRDKSHEVNRLKQELANEREPIRREFDAIRLRLLTSTLAPEIAQELGNLKALILSRRELLERKDVGDFFIKWIKPYDIYLHFGAQLDLDQKQYRELMQDLAAIGNAPKQKEQIE